MKNPPRRWSRRDRRNHGRCPDEFLYDIPVFLTYSSVCWTRFHLMKVASPNDSPNDGGTVEILSSFADPSESSKECEGGHHVPWVTDRGTQSMCGRYMTQWTPRKEGLARAVAEDVPYWGPWNRTSKRCQTRHAVPASGRHGANLVTLGTAEPEVSGRSRDHPSACLDGTPSSLWIKPATKVKCFPMLLRCRAISYQVARTRHDTRFIEVWFQPEPPADGPRDPPKFILLYRDAERCLMQDGSPPRLALKATGPTLLPRPERQPLSVTSAWSVTSSQCGPTSRQGAESRFSGTPAMRLQPYRQRKSHSVLPSTILLNWGLRRCKDTRAAAVRGPASDFCSETP